MKKFELICKIILLEDVGLITSHEKIYFEKRGSNGAILQQLKQ